MNTSAVTVTVIVTVTETFTLDELTTLVANELEKLAVEQANGQVSAVPDGRTLRYYATLGLLDRPVEVRGRRSFYGQRHVVQAVAIKALQAQGLALHEIQQLLAGKSDSELRTLIGRPTSVRFWQAPPSSAATDTPSGDLGPTPASSRGRGPTAGSASSPSVAPLAPQTIEPLAIRLAPGVTVLVDPTRIPTSDDGDAIRRAGGPLLRELTRRGLTPSNPNDQEQT